MTPRFRTVWIVLVAAAAVVGLLRAVLPGGAPPAGDFLRYDRGGTMVWRGEAEHLYDDHHRVWTDADLPEMRFRYTPGLAVALAPLGALPPGAAWGLWSALCAALTVGGAGLAVALALRRLPAGAGPWIPAAAAVVPLLALYSENVKLGQMNCWAFGLSLGAVWAFDRRRDRTAGILAAGAALAKHLPALLILWFLWKRRWKAAAWGFGGMAVLFYLLPTAVLGPASHHARLAELTGQEGGLLVNEVDEAPGWTASGRAEHVEGQSVKALLYRYLTPTRFFHLRKAPAIAKHGSGEAGILVNGGRSWDPGFVHGMWVAAIFLLLATAAFATEPIPAAAPEAAARLLPLEAALLLAVLLLGSPESRNPHFQMLAPGFAALAAGLRAEGARGASWWGRACLAGAAALLVGISTKGVLGDAADAALARGTIGFGGILLFAALTWTLFRERRAVAAAP